MPIPLIVWGGAALAIVAFGAGSGAGAFTMQKRIGDGLQTGLKFGVPIAAGSLIVYAALEGRK